MLPWGVVVAAALALTVGLWTHLDTVFAGNLSTDTMLASWFHGRVAAGGVPAELSDFDFPDPYETAREFPSVADAVLLAPLVRAVGWPGHWNLTIVLGVVLAGLGAAGVAKATGVGDRGVVVAGLLGVLCRPLWFEAISARFNAVFPGIVLIGVALAAAALRAPRAAAVPLMVAGVAAGVVGLWVYPLWAALLLPLALVALGPAVRDATWRRRGLLLAGAAVAGLALAFLLQDAFEARVSAQACLRLRCPDRYHSVDLRDAFRVWVDDDGLARGGLALAPWLLAGFGLMARRGGVVLLAAALALLGLALGPCPRLSGEPVLSGVYAHDPTASPTLWCALGRITDYGRFGTAASLCLAVLGGQAAHVLGEGRWWRAVLAWLAAAAAVGWCASTQIVEMGQARRWHTPPVPATARFLQTAAPGAVAELPFDRKYQFLSALAAPGHPRVNPLKNTPRPGGDDPTVRWLRALGTGRVTAPPPPGELAQGPVRWVLWDPGRCGVPAVPKAACADAIPAQLTQALGPPVWSEGEVRAWAVGR